jgi:putative membrane protein
MKRKPISFLQIAAITMAASVFALASVNAQMDNTSVSDNPHLRAKDAPKKQQEVKVSDKDRKFIQTAANGGVAEVADGNFAEQHAQGAETKKIAAHMVADHTRANKELAELGKKKGLNMDMSAGKPRNFRKENYDGDYLATMESDHKADIKIFEAEAKSGDDAEIKGWAAKTLPNLKMHLSMVQSALKSTHKTKKEE